MKILIATDNYYPNVNGSSYFTQRLAYYLQERGHEVLVFAPSLGIKRERLKINNIDVFGMPSVPVFVYKGFRLPLPFLAYPQIERAVKEFAPDVVHIQDHFFIGATVYRVAARNHIPVVGTNHFMPENLTHYLHLPEHGEKAVASLGWRHFRSIYEKLDMVTTPTKAAADLLYKVGFSKPVQAVSCGIDRTIFNTERNGDELEKKYALPNVPTLLFVGRLDKEKNVDLLLKVFTQVIKNIPAHFVVVGKGAEAENLRSLTKELKIEKNVTFTGFVSDDDIPNIYHVADCFIISGIAELQSIVTMEAMASGLPVIAVNAVALPELVQHGQNGYLFDFDKPDELKQYMQNILANQELRKKMSAKSLEIIAKHEIKNTMENYENIYREVAKIHA